MTRVLIENTKKERQHKTELKRLADGAKKSIDIATAYLSTSSIIPNNHKDLNIRLITSFTANDLLSGAVSLQCLKELVQKEVPCRVVVTPPQGIFHPKVYLFDGKTAVISSLNMTDRALHNNVEVGVIIDEITEITKLYSWFDYEWKQAKKLNLELIQGIQAAVDLIKPKAENPIEKNLEKTLNQLFEKAQLESTHGSDADLVKLKNDCLSGKLAVYLGNSNRKTCIDYARKNNLPKPSEFPHEIKMLEENIFMAWNNTFNYLKHLEKAKEGDVVFLNSKELGIIAIGCVSSVKLNYRDPTILNETSREWYLGVNWLKVKLDNPFFLGPGIGNNTFRKIKLDGKISVAEVFNHFQK